jgi:hypothetical protein
MPVTRLQNTTNLMFIPSKKKLLLISFEEGGTAIDELIVIWDKLFSDETSLTRQGSYKKSCPKTRQLHKSIYDE